jgi:hypothetical protein
MGKLIRAADRLAQEHTERAIETIANIMNDWSSEDRDRINAANSLLDRGHGKPVAAVISIPASRQLQAALSAMSDEDLEAQILDQPLPRLVKATLIEHHQPALDFDHDPLLD